MSADAGLPPTLPGAGGEPPQLPRPKASRWPRFVVAGCALVAVVLFASLYRHFPSDEERKYFGWWYGVQFEDETEAHAWVAEFREDGTIRIQFGRYHRVNSEKAWQLQSNEETGRWRVRDGVQHLVTEDPAHPAPWYTRFERWQDTGDARRQHYYRTTQIDEHELRYTALPDGPDYRARHAKAAVELPPEPSEPEKWNVSGPTAGAR